jgi:flagellar basal body-associated protein FliL
MGLIKRFWPLIVLLVVGEGVVLALLKVRFDPAEPDPAEIAVIEEQPWATVMYGKPITVVANPIDTGGLRIVIVEFDLYLDNELTIVEVDEHLGKINDRILALLGMKSIEDLQEPHSVAILKHELATAITDVLPKGECFDTCIRMLVVQ